MAKVKQTIKKSLTKPSQKSKAPIKVTKTFSKNELLISLAEKANITKKEAILVLEGLEKIIYAHLKKGSIEKFVLPGILKINVKNIAAKKARLGRNPATGETIMLKAKPASKKIKITALKKLKAVV